MHIITIDKYNIDREHICCAIGADKQNHERALSKKEWMKARFEEGLTFKRFDLRGKFFIEYMPIEKAWKPMTGVNYMAIHCLWVSGQYKGKGMGAQLLEACITDAKAQKKAGVAVITSAKTKPFLTDKKFFLKHGFEVVDTAPPYFELMALRLDPNAPTPVFSPHVRSEISAFNSKGISLVWSRQCPFMNEYVGFYTEIARRMGIECQSIELENCMQAQQWGSPFGTFGVYLRGRFAFHELMTEAKFEDFLRSAFHSST